MSTQFFSRILETFPSLSQYTNYLGSTPTLPTLDGADLMLIRLKSLITIHLPLLISIDLSDLRLRATFLSCWAYAVIYYLAAPFSRRFFEGYGSFSRADQIEWNTRVGSNVNAVFCTIAAALLFLDSATPSIWNGVLVTNPKCDIVFSCFLGYIIVDLIICFRHRKTISGFQSTLVHHIVAISSYSLFMIYEVGHLHGVFFLFTEFTTPFVNARWMLSKMKKESESVYIYNGVCMAVGFFLIRVVCQAYFAYILWLWLDDLAKRPLPVYYYLQVQYIVITVLNTYWFTLIARGARKVLFGNRNKAKIPSESPSAHHQPANQECLSLPGLQ